MTTNIKKFCDEHRLTEDQFYGREKSNGYLDLRSLTSIAATAAHSFETKN